MRAVVAGLQVWGLEAADPGLARAVKNQLGPVAAEERGALFEGWVLGLLRAYNESSKLYYYLRSGLPAISEESVPNNGLISSTGLGFVVPFRQPEVMARSVAIAVERRWDHRHVCIVLSGEICQIIISCNDMMGERKEFFYFGWILEPFEHSVTV